MSETEPHKTMEAFQQVETLTHVEGILDKFMEIPKGEERTELFETLKGLLEVFSSIDEAKCCVNCGHLIYKENIKLCKGRFVIPAKILYRGCKEWANGD